MKPVKMIIKQCRIWFSDGICTKPWVVLQALEEFSSSSYIKFYEHKKK